MSVDCDEDEMDADLVQNRYFMVKFTLVGGIFPTVNVDAFERTRQAMDVILKSTLHMIGLKAFGRNPRAFHFPEENQDGVVNSKLLRKMMKNVRSNFFSIFL